MSDNFAEFSADLDAFSREVDVELKTTVKRVAFQAFSSVVSKSPVDKGRFRASWTMAEGVPDLKVQPDAPSGAVSFYSIPTPPDLGSLSAYPVIHISNSLPYAQALENGSSSQAPQGMVALTMAELNETFSLRG